MRLAKLPVISQIANERDLKDSKLDTVESHGGRLWRSHEHKRLKAIAKAALRRD
jgi:hypothetical protein